MRGFPNCRNSKSGRVSEKLPTVDFTIKLHSGDLYEKLSAVYSNLSVNMHRHNALAYCP